MTNYIKTNKEIIDSTIDISEKTKLTFYDSLYIAVAISKRGLLFTEDEEVLKNKDNFEFIKSLDEFKWSNSL